MKRCLTSGKSKDSSQVSACHQNKALVCQLPSELADWSHIEDIHVQWLGNYEGLWQQMLEK